MSNGREKIIPFNVDGDSVADPFRQCCLFSGLSVEQMTKVHQHGRRQQLEKGRRLFTPNDLANSFYLLSSGQIKLCSLSPQGQEKVFEVVQAGDTFAEALMFMPEVSHYPVYAEAIEDSEVFAFDNQFFKALLAQSVETCFSLLACMSRRTHRMFQEVERLTLHNATYRLINYLLQHADKSTRSGASVHLSITKTVLASRLSIQLPSLSRILARLHQDGLIEVQGQEIRLVNIDGLRSLEP